MEPIHRPIRSTRMPTIRRADHRRCRGVGPPGKDQLDPPGEQQDNDDHEDNAESTARKVAPVPAISPARQGADQEQNEQDKQNGTKHDRISLKNSFGESVSRSHRQQW
jgi:hypothetical protein